MNEEKNIPIEDETLNETVEEVKSEEVTPEEVAATEEKAPAKEETAQAEEKAAEEEPEKTGEAEKDPKDEKLEELNAKYMRLMADFQNQRKRFEKERADIYQYANEKIVGDILPVLDNFERALDAEGGDLEAYAKGMQLIFEQLKKALENAGLEEIKAMDEEFDPNVHNAVMTDNLEEKEDGTITKVLQKGYKLKDKVIRPSMVAVNKK